MHEQIQLHLQSPYPTIGIEHFKIEEKPNQHVFMNISILINSSVEDHEIESVAYGSPIRLAAIVEGIETDLFCGVLYSAEVEHCSDLYTANIVAVSGTIIMDNAFIRRSFQDERMSYSAMQAEIMSSYGHYHLIPTLDTSQTICAPLLQYDETDWAFFLRQASHFNNIMYAGCSEFIPQIWFGFPISQNTHILDERIRHKAFKDLVSYRKAKARGSSADESDFLSYRIKTVERYDIGDEVQICGKTRYIAEKQSYLENACVCYTYMLKSKASLFQPKYWNEKAFGLQLKGRVLDTKGEAVKTHFHIDPEQAVDEAFWFPFAPPTGTLMYCMPQHGTHIVVAYTELHEQTAQAWGCFRTNGQVAPKTADHNIRYLQTEHGSEMEMAPTTMHFSGTEKTDGNLIFTLSDLLGNEFKSNTCLDMSADQEILIHSDQTVNISGTGIFMNSGLGAVVEITNDVDVNGSTGFMFGNHVELFAPINTDFAELLAAVQKINKEKAEQDAILDDINRWQQEIDADRTPDWWPLHKDDEWWITEPQIDAWVLNNQGFDREKYSGIPINTQLGNSHLPGTTIGEGWITMDGTDTAIIEMLLAWQQSNPEARITGESSQYFDSGSVLIDMQNKLEVWADAEMVDLNTITYEQLDKIAVDHTMQKLMGQAVAGIIGGVGMIAIAAAPTIKAGAVNTYNKAANAWNSKVAGNYGRFNLNINNPFAGGGNFALAGGGSAGTGISISIPVSVPQVAVWSPAGTGAVALNPSAAAIMFAVNGSGFGGGGGDGDIQNTYKSIKDAPNYPEGFNAKKGGTTKNTVKNKSVLDKLRKVESGTWHKVYKDGYDQYGKKISVHYFESQSGQVFDVKVKSGWSNP